MDIVDFRVRPNTEPFFPLTRNPSWNHVFRTMGYPPPTDRPVVLKEFMEEVDALGIATCVCVGRDIESSRARFRVPNDYVAQIVREYPGRIVGFAGIDPLKGRDALCEIDRAVKDLGLAGVGLDPFEFGMDAGDRRLYRVYERCAALDVPVILTLGPLPLGGVPMRLGSVLPVDDVATDFPELTLVCVHGGWPFTTQMIAIAMRHERVYFDTSIYFRMPGAELVVEAANRIIPDKILYASSYPFAPLKESLERFLKLPFTDDARRKVMGENARRLLRR